jgi:hypothetical protein
MQNQDLVQKFHALRSALLSERKAIQNRLHQIDAALSLETGAASSTVSRSAAASGTRRRGRKRAPNSMSLRDAVGKVLTSKPISRQELLSKLDKVGYRFATSNPLNSLQTFLYGSGKRFVTRVDGNFAAAGASASAGRKASASKPAKAKRKLSPEARKRIADAVKARWARQKAAQAVK